mmetsp:Transcript_8320/g.21710  ORF Transcript_8320/g.21710 Transcript_8320/m.21710 type:complete len:297 (+) Transcript_8320:80-970(+)
MYAACASADGPTIVMKSSGSLAFADLGSSTAAPSNTTCSRAMSMHSVTFRAAGKSLSTRLPSRPLGDSVAAFHSTWAGSRLPSAGPAVYLKSRRRCDGKVACAASLPCSTCSASAAAASSCSSRALGSTGASAGGSLGSRHRRSSRELRSQRSGLASPSPSASAGSRSPSCTGCSMMSHSATAAHASVAAQAARRRRCLCWPGSAVFASVRTTSSGSSRSTSRSLQPSVHTATRSAPRRAASAHRCHVTRCGKHTTNATAAATSSARHVANSPASGGSAASRIFGGDRPQAATAAM